MLREVCEVSGEEWALVYEGHFGSLPGVDFYRIPEVPEGRLASVLLDSLARSESCTS